MTSGTVYGLGSRDAARLSACPPSVRPIFASSPVAWTAVVTSSVPDGGLGAGSRRGEEGFFLAASDGEPERTARGLGAAFGAAASAGFGFGFGLAGVAGLPTAFGVARVGFAAARDTGSPSRRRA